MNFDSQHSLKPFKCRHALLVLNKIWLINDSYHIFVNINEKISNKYIIINSRSWQTFKGTYHKMWDFD